MADWSPIGQRHLAAAAVMRWSDGAAHLPPA